MHSVNVLFSFEGFAGYGVRGDWGVMLVDVFIKVFVVCIHVILWSGIVRWGLVKWVWCGWDVVRLIVRLVEGRVHARCHRIGVVRRVLRRYGWILSL